MKTSEFIDLLKKHPELPLNFEYQEGRYLREDFHITEIKNVAYDTVDCGGLHNIWDETHVQLWENEAHEPDHSVNTTKALKIFQVVENVRPTLQDTEIKFEYGNPDFPTAILPVSNVIVTGKHLTVQLIPEQTTCKAKDRALTPEGAAAACCAKPVKKKVQLVELSSSECTPGGRCC